MRKEQAKVKQYPFVPADYPLTPCMNNQHDFMQVGENLSVMQLPPAKPRFICRRCGIVVNL